MSYDPHDDYQHHVNFYSERRLSQSASREPIPRRVLVRHDGSTRVWDEAVRDRKDGES